MMERIFNDENEPFWRSAKRMDLGVIAPDLFRGYIAERFQATGKDIDEAGLARILELRAAIPTRPRSSATSPGRPPATGRPRVSRRSKPASPEC